eukprot:EG_transcript_17340
MKEAQVATLRAQLQSAEEEVRRGHRAIHDLEQQLQRNSAFHKRVSEEKDAEITRLLTLVDSLHSELKELRGARKVMPIGMLKEDGAYLKEPRASCGPWSLRGSSSSEEEPSLGSRPSPRPLSGKPAGSDSPPRRGRSPASRASTPGRWGQSPGRQRPSLRQPAPPTANGNPSSPHRPRAASGHQELPSPRTERRASSPKDPRPSVDTATRGHVYRSRDTPSRRLAVHAKEPAGEPLSARTVRIHDVDAVYPVAGRTVATMEELREELQAVKREAVKLRQDLYGGRG